jgi:hypothetical protein
MTRNVIYMNGCHLFFDSRREAQNQMGAVHNILTALDFLAILEIKKKT